MARTKGVSRKEKRRASSTHSSQDDDSRPHKASKADEDNRDAGSSIQMINSSNLKRYRKIQRQRQQLAAQSQDEWTRPPGIRPPSGSGFRRGPHTVRQPRLEVAEQEEQEEQEEFYTSYGGNDSEERDQRFSGWAGSVTGARAGDPDDGVEYDEAIVQFSSPNAAGGAHDEDDGEEGANEEENAIPSIETNNARPSAGEVARTRAVVPAQPSTQTSRRSKRLLRHNSQVSIARIPDAHFDPVAHLNKPALDVRDLSNKYPQAPAGIIACTAADFKARRQAFLDSPRPDGRQALFESFTHANPISRVLDPKPNGVSIKSSEEGRSSTVHTSLGAKKQNATIKYFDREYPTNHGHVFASNSSAGNGSDSPSLNVSDAQAIPNRDHFPVSAFNYGGSSNSNEINTCAFADCPCHHATARRLPQRYVFHVAGGAWIFHPTKERGYSHSLTSPSETKSHHDRDYFPDSGYEQHNLDYGSQPREDCNYFPMQTCVLDYDGDAQMKEEAASEAGGSAEEGYGQNDNGEDGSAGGDSPPADENGACNGGSDDEDPEGGEQEIKPEASDSSSDNSEDDMESEESVQGSENPVVGEDSSAEEDKSDSRNSRNYASVQTNNTTTATPWRNTDPWGRIRPPQAQGIRTPPRIVFPSAQPYRPFIPQITAPGFRRDSTANAIILPNCDTFGTTQPPARQGLRLARRGGLPDAPFTCPQTRQNTAANRARGEPLSPGQGYVSITIAEQQTAQMLHSYEGVRTVESGDGEHEDAEGVREQDEGHEAENGGAENDGTAGGEAAGYD